MKHPKILITSDHLDIHPDRTYGPYTSSSDLEITPFVQEGYAPFLLPAGDLSKSQIDSLVESVEIVLFSGGKDVNPILYGEEVLFENVQRYNLRDKIEMMVMQSAVEQGKKVFGICRGQQLINVYFGGTLFQNAQEQAKSKVRHMQDQVDQLAHKITIDSEGFLKNVYSESVIWINSYHNQAIKDLGKGLKISAKSQSDNIIEAIEHTSLPVYAVQWHPEVSYHFDENSKKLIHSIRTS